MEFNHFLSCYYRDTSYGGDRLYADMLAHLESVPGVRAVVNFSSILLEQIADYANRIAAWQELAVDWQALDSERQAVRGQERQMLLDAARAALDRDDATGRPPPGPAGRVPERSRRTRTDARTRLRTDQLCARRCLRIRAGHAHDRRRKLVGFFCFSCAGFRSVGRFPRAGLSVRGLP